MRPGHVPCQDDFFRAVDHQTAAAAFAILSGAGSPAEAKAGRCNQSPHGLAFKLRPAVPRKQSKKKNVPFFPSGEILTPPPRSTWQREMFVRHLKTLNCRGLEVVLL